MLILFKINAASNSYLDKSSRPGQRYHPTVPLIVLPSSNSWILTDTFIFNSYSEFFFHNFSPLSLEPTRCSTSQNILWRGISQLDWVLSFVFLWYKLAFYRTEVSLCFPCFYTVAQISRDGHQPRQINGVNLFFVQPSSVSLTQNTKMNLHWDNSRMYTQPTVLHKPLQHEVLGS